MKYVCRSRFLCYEVSGRRNIYKKVKGEIEGSVERDQGQMICVCRENLASSG